MRPMKMERSWTGRSDSIPLRRRRMILQSTIIAALLFLTACAGASQAIKSDTNTTSPADAKKNLAKGVVDPCSLLTKEDAEAVLGTAVKQGKSQGLSTAATCQYLREKAETMAQAGESVTLQFHFGSGSSFDSYVKNAEAAFKTKAQTVTGVGDQAVFNGDQFIVRYKDDFFIILIGKKMNDAERIEAAKALARRVIDRYDADEISQSAQAS